MMSSLLMLLILCLSISENTASKLSEKVRQFTSQIDNDMGTKWALLIAGSKGWKNYRHQADVCHAYQLLVKGGLNKDNIIVFMYDDIAHNIKNPFPGFIYNNFYGRDVYQGVIIDYRGENVIATNIFDCINGYRGSGKKLQNGPNDHIFIYFSGHGNSKRLLLPGFYSDPIYAMDLRDAINQKQVSTGYNSMVIYVESCLGGSMFEDLYPDILDVYAVTATNASEKCYAYYCPRSKTDRFDVCLGNLFSISWIEHSEVADLDEVTLAQQYELVRKRVARSLYPSHVQQFGNLDVAYDTLSTYMGSKTVEHFQDHDSRVVALPQLEASLYPYKHGLETFPVGSPEYNATKEEYDEILTLMKNEKETIEAVSKLVFGNKERPIAKVPYAGDPYYQKSLLVVYAKYCGQLSEFGLEHEKHFYDMYEIGVTPEELAEACIKVCSK